MISSIVKRVENILAQRADINKYLRFDFLSKEQDLYKGVSLMENINANQALQPRVGVAAWVVEGGKVLMGRRAGSHGNNTWAPPGGHLEFGEIPKDGAIRELKEEVNLDALETTHACWTNDIMTEEHKHYISLHMVVTRYEGELKLMEPNKCREWRWLSIEEIPENLFVSSRNFIETGILQKYMEESKEAVIC